MSHAHVTPRFKATDLDGVKKVVVHANCPDGLASALILKNALHPRPLEVVFVRYSSPEHLTMPAEEGLLFCDFSPPEERAAEFVAAGAIVLDHHKTAKAIVELFGDKGVFGDEQSDPGVCGAYLAFIHVWQPCTGTDSPSTDWPKGLAELHQEVGAFAALAGIRDTWQRQHPQWDQACKQALGLMFYARDTWMDEMVLEPYRWRELAQQVGHVLWHKEREKVDAILRESYRHTSEKGTRVVLFNSVSQTSDASDVLGGEADLVAGFRYLSEGGVRKLQVSCRSTGPSSFDAGAFCKAQGGGGHTKAAGFSIEMAQEGMSFDPYTMFESVLAYYEEHGVPEADEDGRVEPKMLLHFASRPASSPLDVN